jgi:hypothetical protein
MRMLRVSVAGLMALILMVSLGLAALHNPTIVWASSLFTLTVVLLTGYPVIPHCNSRYLNGTDFLD